MTGENCVAYRSTNENVAGAHRSDAFTPHIAVGLLTGCQDRHYAFGLAMALASSGVVVDIIGGDEIDSPDFHTTANVNFLNMGGGRQGNASFFQKLSKMFVYYAKLIRYSAVATPKILHILWNNRFEYFDRTLLMLYYKACGKKIVFTAHNVNQARRDGKDSAVNRLTLRIQYRLSDHIFVHTQKMKRELLEDFGVRESRVTVIRYPLNNAFPDTGLSSFEAKHRLGITEAEKTILFFGRVSPYKGLDLLLAAFRQLVACHADYRLIIAGQPRKGCEQYSEKILQEIKGDFNLGKVILKLEFIPDEDMELYFKAADVLVLPYKEIFQSGVLFLGYGFGLPVIATDVGSFREEIMEGRTGFLCKPDQPGDMATVIEKYFASDLYKRLSIHRPEIKDYLEENHSSEAFARATRTVYLELSARRPQ